MEEEPTVELLNGLNISDLVNGGAVLDINSTQSKAKEDEDVALERECQMSLQNYLKLDCTGNDPVYDGTTPFTHLAKQMTNLIVNGKVKKQILREGYGSDSEQNSTVTIHYIGYFEYQSEPFDCTFTQKKPFTFAFGQGQVVPGLEIAVKSMKINEKSQFLIDPELAYKGGSLGRIPPNATVLFEVELLDLQKTPNLDLNVNEKEFKIVHPICLGLCVKGKSMFRLKDYEGAIKVYQTAAKKLEEAILENYDEQLDCEKLLVRLYTNLLICNTHANIPKRGCIYAQSIHEMAKNKTFTVSAKVYFNHAKCLRMLGGFDRAQRQLRQALRLEPNNPEIQEEFEALKEAINKYREREKAMARTLFTS